jgi:hypothetical protein
MEIEAYRGEIERVRGVVANENCQSQTSIKFQDDVFEFILKNQKHGKGIVEVGCYKGGSSAILALACKTVDWPLYIVDISVEYLDITKRLLEKLGFINHVFYFHGTLNEFAARTEFIESPLLVLIDGDHEYAGVLKDIESLYLFSRLSYAAAFHDFSLRHNVLNERVDKAIVDFFGKDIPLMNIGVCFDKNTSYPLKDRPNPDGHFCELDGPEGVIIKLPPVPKIGNLDIATTFFHTIKKLFRLG